MFRYTYCTFVSFFIISQLDNERYQNVDDDPNKNKNMDDLLNDLNANLQAIGRFLDHDVLNRKEIRSKLDKAKENCRVLIELIDGMGGHRAAVGNQVAAATLAAIDEKKN